MSVQSSQQEPPRDQSPAAGMVTLIWPSWPPGTAPSNVSASTGRPKPPASISLSWTCAQGDGAAMAEPAQTTATAKAAPEILNATDASCTGAFTVEGRQGPVMRQSCDHARRLRTVTGLPRRQLGL